MIPKAKKVENTSPDILQIRKQLEEDTGVDDDIINGYENYMDHNNVKILKADIAKAFRKAGVELEEFDQYIADAENERKKIANPPAAAINPEPAPSVPLRHGSGMHQPSNVQIKHNGPLGVIEDAHSFEYELSREEEQMRNNRSPDIGRKNAKNPIGGSTYGGSPDLQNKNSPNRTPQNGYNDNRYKDNRDLNRQYDIDNELQKNKQKQQYLKDQHEQEMERRADQLRRDRQRREAEDDRLMADRESQISKLIAGTSTKTRLLPSETQTSNISAYAKIKSMDFDLHSLSSKAQLIANDVNKLSKEITREERVIEDELQAKGDLETTQADVRQHIRDLEGEKETLLRKIRDKKDEVIRVRLDAGGGSSKTPYDDEVERDIRGIDTLLMLKMQEYKREKAKFESLKTQYEDYSVDQQQKKAKMRNDEGDNDISKSVLRSTPKANGAAPADVNGITPRSRLEYSAAKQYHSHLMPQVSSELVKTEGSRFLDEFNRDIQRLLYHEE